MKRLSCVAFIALVIAVVPALAQETCPASIIRSFARAGAACSDVERNQACYGSGSVNATFDASASVSFTLEGERADTGLMQQLNLSSADAYSIAKMQLQMSLLSTQPGRNVLLLAFGDVTLTNLVPVRPDIPIESTGVLNVRDLPATEGDILEQYSLRTTLDANGITEDGRWLRVEVPNSATIGWAARDLITTTDDLTRLNIVDENTPYLRPFQVFTFRTGHADAPCSGAPQSGILLQTPNNEDAVSMTVNGLDLQAAGTFYLQATEETMQITALDGQAKVLSGDRSEWVVAGSRLVTVLDAANSESALESTAPLVEMDLTGLPLNSLNYRVRLPDVLTQEAIQTRIAELESEPIEIVQGERQRREYCYYTTRGRTILYAGPGTFYEVIRELTSGTRIYPALRLEDSSGASWWQLNNGHWMSASRATSTGDCGEIPLTDVIQPPPGNTLVLETCDPLNGPIRAGQWVTIQFEDGGWPTIDEAINAPTIDPGHITVNQQWLYVRVSEPRQVAEERFYRTFSGTWYAEAGTYRIVGSRLSYTLICDITVTVN